MSWQDMDDRVRYECNACCYAISGVDGDVRLEDRLDYHELENFGHRMVEAVAE